MSCGGVSNNKPVVTQTNTQPTQDNVQQAQTQQTQTPAGVAAVQNSIEINGNNNTVNVNIINGANSNCNCQCAQVPAPDPVLQSAPVGKGLSVSKVDNENGRGFPAGTTFTAGGYAILPQGLKVGGGIEDKNSSQGLLVFGPDQKYTGNPNDAMTRIWGDPHVDTHGKRAFDFTQDSNFDLPDGTRIFVDTEKLMQGGKAGWDGRTFAESAVIQNGNEMVSITGLNDLRANNPLSIGEVHGGGYQWRAQQAGTGEPNTNTFLLGAHHKPGNVEWYKQTSGTEAQLITGAKYVGNGQYEQNLDPNKKMTVGTQQYGNAIAAGAGCVLGQQAPHLQDGVGQLARAFLAGALFGENPFMGLMAASAMQRGFGALGMFGGLDTCFPSFNHAFGAVGGMFETMWMQQELMQAAMFSRLAFGRR